MRRFKQISSRLADVVTFLPATVDDVKQVCAKLSDINVADDLAEEVQKRTGGRLRDVKTALGRIEHQFRRERGVVKLSDWQATRKALISGERPMLQAVVNG
jgi:hypothetical protein